LGEGATIVLTFNADDGAFTFDVNASKLFYDGPLNIKFRLSGFDVGADVLWAGTCGLPTTCADVEGTGLTGEAIGLATIISFDADNTFTMSVGLRCFQELYNGNYSCSIRLFCSEVNHYSDRPGCGL
jgi:hypothetical protein